MTSSTHAQLLKRYAEIIVKVGLNLRKGQRLLIHNSRTRGVLAQAAPLVHEVTRAAYSAGAAYVDVIWGDEEMIRIRLQSAAQSSLAEYSTWHISALVDLIAQGGALLTIVGENPGLLGDLDPLRVSIWQKSHLKNFRPVGQAVANDTINWCLVAAAGPDWARKVFPKISGGEAEKKLWADIFAFTYADRSDPIRAWKTHARDLNAYRKYLATKQYAMLHYKAPGTDLQVGLPKGHRWITAQSPAANGITFIPNLPTEEIFTLPDRSRIEGTVKASLPLSYSGTLIEDFSFRFEKGRVVKAVARRGEQQLRKLIATDPGAARLGEVALVPASSPIAKTGHLFYNTLFDENAASHLALGRAYRFTLDHGPEMSDAEFEKHGGNNSLAHVDFMIGSDKMDIDGIRESGRVEPVMRKGEWAFKV